ncbi:porin family protein [Mucilaginibacter sp.]|uniref:porin family protein n=1 Tax=Mucilaginibacter sp. TaxID=1882438 RepID=UPI0028476053|nr:porin family protein [Mucilaginibacter sp.]MDR3697425.1 porin family protein [Mucilaginibacter sp.]
MKKSIFYLILTFAVFSTFTVNAQNFTLGVRGGISIPNLTAGSNNQNPLNTGYSSRLGPDFGLFCELKFSTHFSLQPMIEYSSQGGKKNGFQAFTTPDQLAQMFPAGQAPTYLYANYNSEAKMNYLMIPILAKYGWDFKHSPIRFYVDAGPFFGLLLNARQVTSGTSIIYLDAQGTQPLQIPQQQAANVPAQTRATAFASAATDVQQSFDATTDVKSSLHTFNMGIEANIGFSYKIGSGNIFIEGGGNYGLLNIQKYAKDGKNETGAAVATIGYSYRFGK